MSDRVRDKKTHHETDVPSTIAFFKISNDVIDSLGELEGDLIYVVPATLLSNVKFTVQDVETLPQTITYKETDREEMIAVGTKIEGVVESKSIVIAEKLWGAWFLTRVLRVGGNV
ncbi:hypothetical protein [Gimesia aquarii]|uniref:Uncharacterized protein n=1 Tax=Gimesia aquarii TaxID=2527964 RepID=A0A517VRB4_9PLAN|nr:hypothetical protein [Gimesia aquarii]QDT95564.1 hypothetical protein V144x_10090 [Gimesia aquarii]